MGETTFEDLPHEIQMHIASMLDYKELSRLSSAFKLYLFLWKIIFFIYAFMLLYFGLLVYFY